MAKGKLKSHVRINVFLERNGSIRLLVARVVDSGELVSLKTLAVSRNPLAVIAWTAAYAEACAEQRQPCTVVFRDFEEFRPHYQNGARAARTFLRQRPKT